jgi:putative inorganic carbon (hco3(-)) transporter
MNRNTGAISSSDNLHFAGLIALFVVFLSVSMLAGYTVAALAPLLILFGLLTIFRLDSIVFFAVLITPLSINLSNTSLGVGMSLPSEPIMFMLFLLFWLKVMHEGLLDRATLLHPVSLVILAHLAWFIVTTAYSTMPLVSVKYTLARCCYVSVFYFMLLVLFRQPGVILRFIWLYLIPLVAVIIYTLIQHALGGFSEEVAHTAMVPFYNDHTAYAAVLSFFVPVMIGLTADQSRTKNQRLLTALLSILLLAATVLSYTRAAWVGLTAALCCYLIFVMRLKTALVYSGIIMSLTFVLLFWTQITMALESNQEVSSDDYGAHIQSIGNISSDDSNVERLNRWACAIRMFANEPIHGYGPGTYMFKYGALQKYSERSGISTNFAEGGGSHSEYLGPLSEQGFLGPILYLAIIAVTIQTTSRFMVKTSSQRDRILARSLLLGLVTYWVHGLLNFFLDTEKASVPHWGFIAALVALQLNLAQDKKADASGIEHTAGQ